MNWKVIPRSFASSRAQGLHSHGCIKHKKNVSRLEAKPHPIRFCDDAVLFCYHLHNRVVVYFFAQFSASNSAIDSSCRLLGYSGCAMSWFAIIRKNPQKSRSIKCFLQASAVDWLVWHRTRAREREERKETRRDEREWGGREERKMKRERASGEKEMAFFALLNDADGIPFILRWSAEVSEIFGSSLAWDHFEKNLLNEATARIWRGAELAWGSQSPNQDAVDVG